MQKNQFGHKKYTGDHFDPHYHSLLIIDRFALYWFTSQYVSILSDVSTCMYANIVLRRIPRELFHDLSSPFVCQNNHSNDCI